MASFETHLTVSTVVIGIITVPLLSSGIVHSPEAILLLFFGVIGGMLPDIDSDNSIPVKIIFKILSLIVPLLLLFNCSSNLPLIKVGLLWILSSIGLFVVFKYAILKLTIHRGVFHTIGMGILVGELLSLLMINLLNMDAKLAILTGVYMSFGFILHLVLDEIYSVNLLNISLKRSFGSALKIYTKNNILGSIIVNISAIALFFKLPNMTETLISIWSLMSNIKIY